MTKLGKYEILEEIGRGGFAVVYKARDTTLNRVVALKVLHPQLTTDPKFVQRFQQEAQTAARLRHPHIVTIHEVGHEAGQHYLAMSYLPGHTLDERLSATKGPLPVELAISIVEQIADALDTIHQQGLVHRDVKPANVMVDSKGQATLLDFGIVRAAEGTRLTTTMAVLGTPEYMAPEQAELQEGVDIDWRADIYALGVVAYEMLVGRPPFTGRSPTAILHKHAYEPPPEPTTLNPNLPTVLEPVLLKALAKGREERFQRAGTLAAELRRALLSDSQVRQRQAHLSSLYQRLQTAATQENWADVLALGGQIQTLDMEYRDVAEMIERARRGLHRPRKRAKSIPPWVWGIGGSSVLIVACCVLTVIFGPRLWSTAISPTKRPTEQPTPTSHVPTTIPTEPPTEELTEEPTEEPTREPTKEPTREPTREPTKEPTKEPTREPTSSPPFTKSTYEQISVAAGDTAAAAATCPEGSIVVGGGYAVNPDVAVYTQYKYGNGWRGDGKNNASSAKLMNVYAVCLYNASGASVTQVHAQITVPPDDRERAVATCPAGSVATGGGFHAYPDGSVRVYNSSKTDSGEGWQSWAYNNTSSNRIHHTYAICLLGSGGTTAKILESADVPAGDTGKAAATCKSGSLVTGGGFAAQEDLVVYSSSGPYSDVEWRVYAKNTHTKDNRVFFGYAICLSVP